MVLSILQLCYQIGDFFAHTKKLSIISRIAISLELEKLSIGVSFILSNILQYFETRFNNNSLRFFQDYINCNISYYPYGILPLLFIGKYIILVYLFVCAISMKKNPIVSIAISIYYRICKKKDYSLLLKVTYCIADCVIFLKLNLHT